MRKIAGNWLGAMRKGREAYERGDPLESCPYEDKRKPSGKLSWSRAFIRAWEDGWMEAQHAALKEKGLIE